MNKIAMVDNSGNNFVYTTCGVPDGFRQATDTEISAYQNKQSNIENLTDSFNTLWSSLSLYWQHDKTSIKNAILSYISVWDLTSLNHMANDITISDTEKPFQQQLKALLTPYLPTQS